VFGLLGFQQPIQHPLQQQADCISALFRHLTGIVSSDVYASRDNHLPAFQRCVERGGEMGPGKGLGKGRGMGQGYDKDKGGGQN
jgi:hypothetical protein